MENSNRVVFEDIGTVCLPDISLGGLLCHTESIVVIIPDDPETAKVMVHGLNERLIF